MPRNTTARRATALGAALALTLSLSGPVAASDHGYDTIADGFFTPLGLSIGQDGTVYVAESFAGQLTTFPLRAPQQRRTLVEAPGATAGVDAVGKGNVFHTVAGETTTLNRVQPNGRSTVVASLSDYEETVNPDAHQEYGFLPGSITEECRGQLPEFLALPYEGIIESNPYAVAIDGGSTLVADAAGNTILRVAANGRISTVAVLPPVEQTITQDLVDQLADDEEFPLELPDCVVDATFTGEFVPTDVEIGPDGHYYVSSLPGAPEAPGAGSVWRVHRSTGELTKVADGFDGAVDLAVAADGTIYVAELFAGRITAVAGGDRWSYDVPGAGAVEIGPDGRVYATAGAFPPGNGSVIRLR